MISPTVLSTIYTTYTVLVPLDQWRSVRELLGTVSNNGIIDWHHRTSPSGEQVILCLNVNKFGHKLLLIKSTHPNPNQVTPEFSVVSHRICINHTLT